MEENVKDSETGGVKEALGGRREERGVHRVRGIGGESEDTIIMQERRSRGRKRKRRRRRGG